MFCRNCGTQNDDGAKFCYACGTPMDQEAPVNAAPVNAAPVNAAPNPGYVPNPGYAPNPGYNPNMRYAPRPAMPMPDILKKVPGIALIVAIATLLLPWFGFGYYGNNTYYTLPYIVTNFADWTKNFGAVMMYLFCLVCIAAPFVCMRLDKKKMPFGKFVGIGAAVVALITMFLVKDYLDVSSLKTHIGFYFYMIAMAAYGVVGILNENNK